MSTTDPTAQELLTAINAAILDLVTGKVSTTSVNGRIYTKLQLADLREMRAELQKEVRPTRHQVRLADMR